MIKESELELYTNKIIEMADMCLDFGKVERRTFHQDGKRPETDTDHTVMLAIIATALAEKLYSDRLNIGLVSQYAVIHDLLEVYAGDTDTLTNTSKEHFADKDRREGEALLRIQNTFGATFPYIHTMIERYESQKDLEARFVKVCDKIMSKVTNILNYNTYPKSKMTKDELAAFLETSIGLYKQKSGSDFPELFVLYEEINKEMLSRFD